MFDEIGYGYTSVMVSLNILTKILGKCNRQHTWYSLFVNYQRATCFDQAVRTKTASHKCLDSCVAV